MRTKKRQTNLQLLNAALQGMTTESPLQAEPQAKSLPIEGAGRAVDINVKVKKPRGAPKAPLINTKRLLTG